MTNEDTPGPKFLPAVPPDEISARTDVAHPPTSALTPQPPAPGEPPSQVAGSFGQDGELTAGDEVPRHASDFRPGARIVGAIIGVGVVLAGWAALGARTGSGDVDLPSIGAVASALKAVLANDSISGTSSWQIIGTTFGRFLAALVVGGSIALAASALAATNGWARAVFQAVTGFFRMIPPILIAAVTVNLTGLESRAIIWIGAAATAWVLASVSTDAFAQMMRGGTGPRATAEVIGSLRLAVMVAWWSVLALEVVFAQDGIAASVFLARSFLRLDEAVAFVVIAGLIGWVIDASLHFLQQRASVRARTQSV